jgi:hypothetical protein
MFAGQKVKIRLIKTDTGKAERLSKGLREVETYEGELLADVEPGGRIWIEAIRTSAIQTIDPVAPGVFDIRTQNSLYELTLL